jgi:hypothetical protein
MLLPNFHRWIDIPSEFHSAYEDGPFLKCLECDCDLTRSAFPYVIQRTFKGAEPIFEMAMCLTCRNNLTEELSKESQMRLNAFVEEHLDLEARFERSKEWGDESIDPWLERCVISKTHRSECREYSLTGFCLGNKISLDMGPMLVSRSVAEHCQKLVSKKSRDRFGEFINDHFGMPPEFVDSPDSYTPVMF